MHNALKNIFFIFGEARSGNTFLSYQIMAHMKVVVPPESNFIANIYDGYKKTSVTSPEDRNAFVFLLFKDLKFSDWGLSKESIHERLSQGPMLRDEAIKQVMSLYCEQQSADIMAFGIQKNYIQLYPKLHAMFPKSKIIHIIRDGRAVFNSQKNSHKSEGRGVFQGNAAKSAYRWVYKNMKLRRFGRTYNNVIAVKYEDLITDVDGTLRSIARFLELKYYAQLLAEMSVPARYGDIHSNVGSDAKPARLEAWKQDLSEEDVTSYEVVAGTYLLQNGYELTHDEMKKCGFYIRLRIGLYRVSQDVRFALGRVFKALKA